MASRVRSTGKFRVSNGVSASGSFGATPSVGNLIIVQISNFNGGLANGDVTDNQGNTYTLAVQRNAGNANCGIFYSVITTASGTFTITVNPASVGNTWMACSASEWSGVWNAGTCLDQTTSNGTSSGTALSTGTTGSLALAGEVIAAVCAIGANQASITVESVSPSWTEEYEELVWSGGTPYVPGEGDTRIVSSTSGQSCSWTAATSAQWTACIATFKENATSAVGSTSGSATLTGVAPTTSVGSAAGTAALTGVASAQSQAAASTSGTATLTGVSSAQSESSGTTTGTGTLTGVSDADATVDATSVQPIFRCTTAIGGTTGVGVSFDGSTSFLGFPGFTRAPWPCAGVFRYLVIRLSDAPGLGSSRTFAIEVNGVATALSVTISDTATRGRYIATTVTVAPGDNVRLLCTLTGAPVNTDAYWSLEFVADNPAESGYVVNFGGTTSGFASPLTGETHALRTAVEYYMPTDGTFTAMFANDTFDGVPSGTHLRHYLYKNGVKQDGTGGTVNTELDLTNTAVNVCVSNSFALSVVRGDRVAVGLEGTGPWSGWNGFGLLFVASTDGVSLGGAGGVGTPSATDTRFLRPLNRISPNWDTDAFNQRVMCGVSSFSIRDFYGVLDVSPGFGRSRAFAIRINNLDTAVGGVIADNALVLDDLESTDISDGSTFTVSHTPSGTPTVTGDEWLSWIYAAAGVVVIERFPPEGGGGVDSGATPTIADVPTGVLRRFFTLQTFDGSLLGAADTDFWHDPDEWYGGYKPAELISISPIERELSRQGDFRGIEVRIVLDDTQRRWRRLAEAEAIATALGSVYIVSDTVRYALGEPYRRFAGPVVDHKALDGLQYEITLRDVASEKIAYLDAEPKLPNKVLTESEFPGLYDRTEGKAAPILIGQVTDQGYSPRQGVVPPLIVAGLNLSYFGGINQSVIACLWSMGAIAENGVWEMYYNPPTQPSLRNLIPLTATNVWTPGRANWFETGLTENYVEYPLPVGPDTRRYTPVFFDATDPLAEPFLNEQVIVAANIFGLTENADGTGLYLDDPSRVWAWLIVNQLLVPYTTGEYAPMPTLDGVYEVIDSAMVERTRLRQVARLAGGYKVGFMLGRDGQQATLRHVLQELCLGTDMQQGINRHGQLIIDTEDNTAAAVDRLSDLLDIEQGSFEVKVDRDWFFNRIERYHGYRYVAPTAPNPAPAEGEPVPKPVTAYNPWLSGVQVNYSQDSIDANRGLVKTYKLENYVVRDDTVAAHVATVLLDRAIGPSPAYDGPRVFRLAGPTHRLIGLELGDNILIDHVDGYGDGYVGKFARVMKISEDTDRWRTVIEGYILGDGSPA